MKTTWLIAVLAVSATVVQAQQPIYLNGQLYMAQPGESIQYVNGVANVLKKGERIDYSGGAARIVTADGKSRTAAGGWGYHPPTAGSTYIFGPNGQNTAIIRRKNGDYIFGPNGQNAAIINTDHSTYIMGPNGQNAAIIRGNNSTYIYGPNGQGTVIIDRNAPPRRR